MHVSSSTDQLVTLAIETSQRSGSVALRDAEGQVHEEPMQSGERHSDDLMPAIDRVARRAGVQPRELGLIVVSRGPGGFSGLRIAISSAKMIAEVAGAAIVGVPSALVAAAGAGERAGRIAVALACKRESCWLTVCERTTTGDAPWKIAGEPRIITADAFDAAGISLLLADSYLPEAMSRTCSQQGVEIEPFIMCASNCLLVGEQLHRAGAAESALSIAPLYAREPEAVRLWADRGR